MPQYTIPVKMIICVFPEKDKKQIENDSKKKGVDEGEGLPCLAQGQLTTRYCEWESKERLERARHARQLGGNTT